MLIKRGSVGRIHVIQLHLVDHFLQGFEVGFSIEVLDGVKLRLESNFSTNVLLKLEFPVAEPFLLAIKGAQPLESLPFN